MRAHHGLNNGCRGRRQGPSSINTTGSFAASKGAGEIAASKGASGAGESAALKGAVMGAAMRVGNSTSAVGALAEGAAEEAVAGQNNNNNRSNSSRKISERSICSLY